MSDQKTAPNRCAKEIDEAGKIAKFYGFQPILPPALEKADFNATKDFDQNFYPAEKAALLRIYFDEKMINKSQPILFYCDLPFPGLKELGHERKKTSKLESILISFGSSKSVCECLSIQTGMAILNSIGYKNLSVEINSIGDKESSNEFNRKITAFIRKNYNSFSSTLRQELKKSECAIFKCQDEDMKKFESECPKPIDFLSETSRAHFKEVVEFLEIMDIPYEINSHLVGDLEMGSETIFTIKTEEGEELASGFRFNRLAKKIGYKKEVPSTILNISAKTKKKMKKVKIRLVKPQFYLIQFGAEAKLKSFFILQELYKAGANVVHSIAKDKLGSQMGVAENSEIPYIILIGQKEALDNSVVIRNTITRAQEVVSISEFPAKIKEYLKKIK